MDEIAQQIQAVIQRLDRIEIALQQLSSKAPVKGWSSPEEVASRLHRSPFTVREWARLGRIHAKKKLSGRGAFLGWVISHEEVERIEREGLLPAPSFS